jgi:hypothetical protein
MDLFKSYRIVNDRRMVSTSDERNESGISVLRIQLTIGEWSALVTKETNQEFLFCVASFFVVRSQLSVTLDRHPVLILKKPFISCRTRLRVTQLRRTESGPLRPN